MIPSRVRLDWTLEDPRWICFFFLECCLWWIFEGNKVRVPFAPPQQQIQMKAVIQKLGPILYHGRLLNKSQYVSVRHHWFAYFMERSLWMTSTLERCFLFYLSQYERDVLTKALSTKLLASFQQDAIFGVYEQYNMTCMTCAVTNTRDQLQSHVVTMARYHFVCRPIPSSMRMTNGMQGRELEAF